MRRTAPRKPRIIVAGRNAEGNSGIDDPPPPSMVVKVVMPMKLSERVK